MNFDSIACLFNCIILLFLLFGYALTVIYLIIVVSDWLFSISIKVIEWVCERGEKNE